MLGIMKSMAFPVAQPSAALATAKLKSTLTSAVFPFGTTALMIPKLQSIAPCRTQGAIDWSLPSTSRAHSCWANDRSYRDQCIRRRGGASVIRLTKYAAASEAIDELIGQFN
jgi:hypothetical protein